MGKSNFQQEVFKHYLETAPEASAESVGLRYVSDDRPGYHRKPWGRGFTYLDSSGEHVQDAELRQRFEALTIPPAWEDVWICDDPMGHIQVTGRDDKGRKQYIYHPLWEETRAQTKFERLIPFGETLPSLRAQVNRDLGRHKLSREKVLAIVVYLLDETLIRVGNPEYARHNDSYGLTTLQDEHLKLQGSQMIFEFTGKSGKEHEIAVRDRRLASMIRRCQELPGQQLFKYVDDSGDCCIEVTSNDVNHYLKDITGLELTAKEFRTWGGTILAAAELYGLGPGGNAKENKHKVAAAVKRVSEFLGNTPAIARKYYVHPKIIRAFLNGTLFESFQVAFESAEGMPEGLSVQEWAVLELLKNTNNDG